MGDKMGPRELKAILATLKAAGVRNYANGDLKIEFQSGNKQLDAKALKASGVTEYEDGSGLKIKFADPVDPALAQTLEGANQDLELPDGVLDPVKMLEKINRRPRAS